jgi:hypothetical protein
MGASCPCDNPVAATWLLRYAAFQTALQDICGMNCRAHIERPLTHIQLVQALRAAGSDSALCCAVVMYMMTLGHSSRAGADYGFDARDFEMGQHVLIGGYLSSADNLLIVIFVPHVLKYCSPTATNLKVKLVFKARHDSG